MSGMSRGLDWGKALSAVRAYIQPGEPVEAILTAVLPGEDRNSGLTIAGLGAVVTVAEHMMRRSFVQQTLQTTGVPLAQRMFIAITPQRLVIGQASRGWELRTIMGDLPRDRLAKVELGAASDRTRRVVLHLNTGESITLRMAREIADQFRDLLS
jgi:hypothetical protein